MPPTFAEIAADAEQALRKLDTVNNAIVDEAEAIRAKPKLTADDDARLTELAEAEKKILREISVVALDAVQRLDASTDIQDLIARVRKISADLNKATAKIRKIGKIADAVGAASDGIKKVSDKLAKLAKDD
ncbi:hypothetical protein [Desertibaculum subflavum]|uniref:hypothetical protein n=1 Tax=Desertibaculum subflavum TaxID=2268458 RepID=UPI000E6753BD